MSETETAAKTAGGSGQESKSAKESKPEPKTEPKGTPKVAVGDVVIVTRGATDWPAIVTKVVAEAVVNCVCFAPATGFPPADVVMSVPHAGVAGASGPRWRVAG